MEIDKRFEEYFDFDYFQKIIQILKAQVQIRMSLKQPPPYNIKTNIVEAEHAR